MWTCEGKDFGLTINGNKTKTMIFNFQPTSLPYPTTICNLSGLAIENVLTFKYLGTIIHYNQTGVGEEEIKNRIIAAKSSFQQRKHILRNFRIFLSIHMQLLDACVRTRLTYGCSAWSVSKQRLQKIDTCYKFMLRKMIRNGLKQTTDYKYIITDKKLHSICKTTNVSDFIKL